MVEVMNTATKQWTTAARLPHPFGAVSGTICRDQLYLAGGCIGGWYGVDALGRPSHLVLTCSLADLLPSQSLRVRLHTPTKPGVWREIRKLPVTRSTLTTLGGHLLAIGGRTDFFDTTADVYCYNHQTHSWHAISAMTNKRYASLSAELPDNQLLIVGGYGSKTSVEIGYL